jgi:hypothetical protein
MVAAVRRRRVPGVTWKPKVRRCTGAAATARTYAAEADIDAFGVLLTPPFER